MIHPKGTLFLRHAVSEAELGEHKYELTTSMAGTPIIRSHTTGKYFTLSWDEMLKMARAEGIDRLDKEG